MKTNLNQRTLLLAAIAAVVVSSQRLPALAAPPPGGPLADDWARPIGRLETTAIPESSGIAKSARYEGIYWTHNDSGNPPELFAVQLDGRTVARIPVIHALNLDWEDIAADGDSLYVGDIGNNFGWLSTRTIYQFAEPDPHAPEPRPIKPTATFRFRYPDDAFDAEALVVRGGQIWIISKSRSTTIYRLTPPPRSNDSPLTSHDSLFTLTPVEELKAAAITGADLSSDGRYLAVTSTWLLSCYPVNEDLTLRDDEQPRHVRYPFGGGIEACCFDGPDVILTSERGGIYRVPQHVIQTQNPFGRRSK